MNKQQPYELTLANVELYIIIAIQVFVTYLEFYIVGALAVILLPFWANSHTRFHVLNLFGLASA